MDYSTHRVYSKRAIMMALLLIAVGIVSLQFRYERVDYSDWHTVLRMFSSLSLLVCGGLLLTPRFNRIMPAIGLMCLGIGLSRFLVACSYAMKPDELAGVDVVLVTAMSILGYIILIFAVYQLYVGLNFMRMDSLNAFLMRFSSFGIVIAYTLLLIYANEFLGFSLDMMWDIRRDFVTTPILYLLYFALLCSEEVYGQMSWEKVRRTVHKVATRMNPGVLTITHAEFENFKREYSEGVWSSPVSPESPVEREYRLPLKGEDVNLVMLIEKWKDSGEIFYHLIPDKQTGYVATPHGSLRDLVFTDEGFEVYQDRHMAFQVIAYDEPPKVKGWRRLFGPNYMEVEEE